MMWTSLFLTTLGLGIIGLFDDSRVMLLGFAVVMAGFAVMALDVGEVE